MGTVISRVIVFEPMRLAGIMKQYSTSAMAHETSTTAQTGAPAIDLRCPYHAYSMIRFETKRSATAVQLMFAI